MTTYEAGLAYTEAGLHVIPIRGDDTKKAALPTWKSYQERPATPEELRDWFSDHPDRGLAIIGSDGLEILDIDDEALVQPFLEAVRRRHPTILDLVPQVATPRPGLHLYLRSKAAGPNQKLAYDDHGQTLIEVRGRGGYVLAPPAPPACHPKNQPSRHVGGWELPRICELSPEDRDLLLSVARWFDRSRPLAPLADRRKKGRTLVEKAPLARSGHGGHRTPYA